MKDAIQEIENNLDVEKIVNYYGITEEPNGDTIRIACPFPTHDSHDPTAFIINIETGVWTCHTQCGNGSIFHFVQEMERINFIQSVNKLCEILGITDAEIKTIEPHIIEARKFLRSKRKKVSKNEEWINEFRPTRLCSYRNYSEETLKYFKAGYLHEGKGISKKGNLFDLHKKIIIPVYEDDILIGCSMRRTDPDDNLKWLHYPAKMQINNTLYNIDSCKDYDEIILTEGIFDVWSYHQAGIPNAVCTFGAHLTEQQYKILMRTGKDITLSYDNDEAGIGATNNAKQMLKNKVQLRQVIFDINCDPGDYTSEELQILHKERIKI